jgi:hypothetical protein
VESGRNPAEPFGLGREPSALAQGLHLPTAAGTLVGLAGPMHLAIGAEALATAMILLPILLVLWVTTRPTTTGPEVDRSAHDWPADTTRCRRSSPNC